MTDVNVEWTISLGANLVLVLAACTEALDLQAILVHLPGTSTYKTCHAIISNRSAERALRPAVAQQGELIAGLQLILKQHKVRRLQHMSHGLHGEGHTTYAVLYELVQRLLVGAVSLGSHKLQYHPVAMSIQRAIRLKTANSASSMLGGRRPIIAAAARA